MKTSNKSLILLLSLLFYTLDANAQETKILENNLNPDIEKTELSDGSFLAQAFQLIYNGNKLYMSEINRQQIVVFDKDLNFINTISRQGRGPDEVVSLSEFSIKKDTVLVKDYGGVKIQIYKNNGAHIKAVSLQDIRSEINPAHNFLYSNDTLTIASTQDSALVRYDFSSGKPSLINKFGKRYEFATLSRNYSNNNRFIDVIDGKIVTISDNLPIIELYNVGGELLSKYDFSSIPMIKKQIEFSNNEKGDQGWVSMLAGSYSIQGNDLYILVNISEPDYTCNKVIKFSLDGNKFIPEIVYTLPGSVYSGVAVSGKYLYSFNSHASSICRFKL